LGFALLHVTIVAWQGVLELQKDFRVPWRNRTYDFCVLTYAQFVVVCYFVQHGKKCAAEMRAVRVPRPHVSINKIINVIACRTCTTIILLRVNQKDHQCRDVPHVYRDHLSLCQSTRSSMSWRDARSPRSFSLVRPTYFCFVT